MSRNGSPAPRLPLPEGDVRPTFRRERRAINRGIAPVAGCDEAGRGPLARPGVAPPVILPPPRLPPRLAHSKKLPPEAPEQPSWKSSPPPPVAVPLPPPTPTHRH